MQRGAAPPPPLVAPLQPDALLSAQYPAPPPDDGGIFSPGVVTPGRASFSSMFKVGHGHGIGLGGWGGVGEAHMDAVLLCVLNGLPLLTNTSPRPIPLLLPATQSGRRQQRRDCTHYDRPAAAATAAAAAPQGCAAGGRQVKLRPLADNPMCGGRRQFCSQIVSTQTPPICPPTPSPPSLCFFQRLQIIKNLLSHPVGNPPFLCTKQAAQASLVTKQSVTAFSLNTRQRLASSRDVLDRAATAATATVSTLDKVNQQPVELFGLLQVQPVVGAVKHGAAAAPRADQARDL